jgi:hypothetical protein
VSESPGVAHPRIGLVAASSESVKVFNENQAKRYQKLQYQYGGFNSLMDPAVQQQMKLTDQQRKALGDAQLWSSQQMENIQQQGAGDNQAALKLYREYQGQHQERFNKILTPEQQQTWQQMTGERYNFQPSFAPPAKRQLVFMGAGRI